MNFASKCVQHFGLVSRFAVCLLIGLTALGWTVVFASVNGSISGIVRDASGAVLPDVQVSATNRDTGVVTKVSTDTDGFYSLQALPVGTYDVQFSKSGFKSSIQSEVLLRVNDALRVDIVLAVGEVAEKITVMSDVVQAETTSTQMGQVISDEKMTTVPLITRSYTDLLALQAGVVPTTSGLSGGLGGQFTSTGFAIQQVSGDLNAGNLSVNGMREAGNAFLLNGASVQELGFSGTAAIPNLDSLQEFRIITNNFDAEYGNYSGGQINVITKSGTNQFHGSAFEFLRNTVFNAKGFFDPTRGAFRQNEFGGTFGGPIKKDKLFFFADYQGTRLTFGQSSGQVLVPSQAERGGDFSAISSQMTGSVQGPFWAQQLSQTLGYAVTAGEPYYTPGCTSSANCVFPNAQIPMTAFAAPAKNMLQYIPVPNGVNGQGQPIFSSAAAGQHLRDDKGSGRLDLNTHIGLLSGYYFFDDNDVVSPNPIQPGFGNGSRGRVQMINFADTKSFASTAVNEARVAFTRLSEVVNEPIGGIGPDILKNLGFTGIVPSVPAFAGVPQINFQNFGVGSGSSPLPIIENTYSYMDNFSKVLGTHTIKFGGLLRFLQLTEKNLGSNGSYSFNGSETGIDFADFLIGAPNNYSQGQGFPSYGRSHDWGLYAQDSWRIRRDLTFNYGLRWEVSSPWSELHNELETIVPGLQSLTFPGSPLGWVFPLDPGIPTTLAPTRYDNFAPRLGLAYSPSASSGFLSKLTGGPGNSSIRVAWGKFYTTFEGATNFNEIGDAPFGYFYGSPAPPEFANPFITRGTGFDNGQRFPVAPPPFNSSPLHPDNSINWSAFLPIGSSPAFYYKNVLPYAEQYQFAIDRQLARGTLLTLAYVGSQGHHLLSAQEANLGNPALCLSLSQPSEVAPSSPTCGPFGESNVYTTAAGQTVNGTRGPLGINFTSNSYFKTIGNSDYNSFQLTLKHVSGRQEFLAGYTYSKSMDTGSGYGEQVNPLDPSLKALSAFDMTHNFVISYGYLLPFDKLASNRFTKGWRVSGITRFSTGLPVTMLETDDRSLLGTSGSGPIQLPVDTPNFTGGPLDFTNPRSGKPNFNTSLFSPEPLGQLGNASRRFFHGPGINNWDISIQKDTAITERTTLQFRAEFFNAFNHAQFGLPDGNVNDATFGLVQSAGPPRLMQFALKLLF
jgi:Carboxypeptidase regulatory-like domain